MNLLSKAIKINQLYYWKENFICYKGAGSATWWLRGRMDDFEFFDCLIPFSFLLIEFHCTFSICFEILPYYVYYYYCILIRWWWAVGTSLFPPHFTSFHLMPFFLPSSVSLSYFILAVPMRQCLGEQSRMNPTFSIAILNGTFVNVAVVSMLL